MRFAMVLNTIVRPDRHFRGYVGHVRVVGNHFAHDKTVLFNVFQLDYFPSKFARSHILNACRIDL